MLIKAAIAEQVGRVREEARKLAEMMPDAVDLAELAADEAVQELDRKVHECKCKRCGWRREAER